MSVLINMEMPISCSDCKAFVCYRQYAGDSGDCFCGITKSDAKAGARNADCPLVPVPPHGRLIDADALDIYRREEQAWTDYERNPDNEYIEGVKDGLHEAAKQLSIAPTIIPASEEGET